MATNCNFLINTKLSNLHQHFHSYPTHIALTPPTRNLKIVSCIAKSRINEPWNFGTKGDPRVMFAMGDIGVHIYPAVAIADELRIKNPNSQILFVGTENGMESTAVPSANYDFAPLPRTWIETLMQSWRKLGEFDPHIVISTGGYSSLLICLIAKLRGIKFVIQEQNAVPGIRNRVLSVFADKIFVAFDTTAEYFPREKCYVFGNPVRLSLRQYKSKAAARVHFFPTCSRMGLEPNVVLILGGSLGANAINVAVLNLYYHMLMTYDNLFIIWQTGIKAFDEMDSLVKHHPRLILTPFLHTMDLAYAAADLVISRAGAVTCFEIMVTGLPSILIPSPNIDEGHQLRNASLMEDLAGSFVISEDELDSTTLGSAIEEILGNENLMAKMSNKALKSAKPNASAEIAAQILSLVTFSTTIK